MYNTPDKHNTNHISRSKFDFSDIDNLDRATEAFMKEQRKALGHRSINLDAVAEQGKRALVFIVLGAIFVTALVAGIRFGYSDDQLRDPNQSVSDDAVASGTNQTTDGSSTDQPKDQANGSAATATTTAETELSVTTEPTTYLEDPVLSTTLPQLTETDEIEFTTTTTTPKETVTTTSGTAKTTTTKKSTTTKQTTTTATTPKKTTTTSTTTTTRKTTTTTSATTTATTTKKTTTTTTTTVPAQAKMTVVRTRVVSCVKEANGSYRTELQISLRNDGNAAADGATVTVTALPSTNCTYAVSTTDGWNGYALRGNACAVTYNSIAAGSSVDVRLVIVTAIPVTGCTATC